MKSWILQIKIFIFADLLLISQRSVCRNKASQEAGFDSGSINSNETKFQGTDNAINVTEIKCNIFGKLWLYIAKIRKVSKPVTGRSIETTLRYEIIVHSGFFLLVQKWISCKAWFRNIKGRDICKKTFSNVRKILRSNWKIYLFLRRWWNRKPLIFVFYQTLIVDIESNTIAFWVNLFPWMTDFWKSC